MLSVTDFVMNDVVMLSVIVPSVVFFMLSQVLLCRMSHFYCYTECLYAEPHHTECRGSQSDDILHDYIQHNYNQHDDI